MEVLYIYIYSILSFFEITFNIKVLIFCKNYIPIPFAKYYQFFTWVKSHSNKPKRCQMNMKIVKSHKIIFLLRLKSMAITLLQNMSSFHYAFHLYFTQH